MVGGRGRKTGIIAVCLALGGIVSYVVLVSMNVPGNRAGAERLVQAISRIQLRDVDRTVVMLDEPGGRTLTLTRERDEAEIARLLHCVKRVRVASREINVNESDRLVVIGRGRSSGVTILGRFDPDRAPVISDTLQSDALAASVYGVFRRHGFEPRE